MKESFSKEINKNINVERLLGISSSSYMLLHLEKNICLSKGMPPFSGSNYIRKKRSRLRAQKIKIPNKKQRLVKPSDMSHQSDNIQDVT